jgi:uncharacterized protein involved in outer membrane biogenesis
MKRRDWKKFGIVMGILTVVLLVSVVVLPIFMDLNRYNGIIVSEIQEAVGGMVSLRHISWGISNGIWLEADKLSIVDATAFPADLKLSRFYAKVSILPLLAKKIVLKKLVLDGSDVKMRLEPGKNKEPTATTQEAVTKSRDDSQPGGPFAKTSGTNFSDIIANGATVAGFQLLVEKGIEQLAVEIGRLELEDTITLPGQTQVRVFTDVDLAATNLIPGKEMAFTIALRDTDASGLGELKAQGTFVGLTESLTLENPKLTMNLKLSALHTDAIKPYLRNSPLAQRLAGNVSLAVNYEGDLTSRHRAEGDIDLSLITYSDPSLWDAALPGAKTTATYLVSLNPDELMLEKLALKLGKLSLKTSGDVHNWRKNPLIKNVKFTADLPLPELVPLMPWKLLGENTVIFRPILENGGKIVIEQAVLPEIDLTEPPATVEAFLPGIHMTAQVSGVSVQPSPDLPKIEGIAGRFKFDNGVLAVTEMRAREVPLSLPDLSIRVTHITERPKVTVRAKGPLQIGASSDEIAAKLLRAHGLKSLSGAVVVDMGADFDLHKPDDWAANGSLLFKGIRAESYPEAVVMDNLEGSVKFSRNKTINITAQDITARINQAPVRLSGRFLEVGTPNPVVDAKAFTKQLDLAPLGELIPALKKTGLAGNLDMDLDIYIPYATPAKSRLNGTLATKNVQFKIATYDVKQGNTELTLAGSTAKINRLQIQVNDLALAATGRITNPVEPDIFLAAKLPNLDIDRLLPPAKSEKRSSKVPPKEDTRAAEKTKKTELPPIARKSTAHLRFNARQGRYKGMKFQNLKLDAVYEHGVIKQYNLNLGVDGGRIATNGSADLRDPEHVEFVLSPKVTSLRLETVAPVLGIEQLPISGPISLTGQLRGRTGTTRELLASLDGNLKTEMGPGHLTKIGKAGHIMAKILTMTSVKSILSG